MRGYQTELISYTSGRGRIFYALKGYEPCHNEQEVENAVHMIQNPIWKIRQGLFFAVTVQDLMSDGNKWSNICT